MGIAKKKLLIIGILCALLMCISGIYAFTFMTAVNVENNVNTGVIDIELKEFMFDEGGIKKDYADPENTVMPGSRISLIPQIQNKGADCYIRSKVTYSFDNTLINVPQDCMESLDSNWQQFGDYWYYKIPLKSGSNLDMFQTFIIPKDLPNNAQSKELTLNIVAEAVQYKNFTPTYNASEPWGNLKIKDTIEYQTDKVQKSSNVKIEYENNANQFINIPDNFFDGLKDLMPGDSITQSINVTAGTQGTKFYFKIIEPKGANEKEIELLKNLKLKITCDNETIFDNSLYQLENQPLGKYQSGEQKEIQFTITMPKELENEYAMTNTALNWKFSVEDDRIQSKPPPVTDDSKPIIDPEPIIDSKPVVEPEQKPVQTGDVKIKIALSVFVIAAIGLIIVCFLEKKRKQQEKNKPKEDNINKN